MSPYLLEVPSPFICAFTELSHVHITSHHITSHLITSHLITSHHITSHLISSHLIWTDLNWAESTAITIQFSSDKTIWNKMDAMNVFIPPALPIFFLVQQWNLLTRSNAITQRILSLISLYSHHISKLHIFTYCTYNMWTFLVGWRLVIRIPRTAAADFLHICTLH